MRDAAYIDAYLKRIKRIWKGFPNASLGQIIGTCMNYQQIYYFSDEEFLQMLEAKYGAAADKNIAAAKKSNFGGKNK